MELDKLSKDEYEKMIHEEAAMLWSDTVKRQKRFYMNIEKEVIDRKKEYDLKHGDGKYNAENDFLYLISSKNEKERIKLYFNNSV